jgi:site-specific DNA-methyltransferase (cytosine-N4-specific)
MTAHVLRADARALPLPNDSVDAVVTSPPFFSLRSYQDGGEHYAGQIGDEADPELFVEALLDVTRECMRVLKPTGSLWLNLGDKYAERAGPARAGGVDDDPAGPRRPANRPPRGRRGSIRAKSLMGIPWRYALGCIDELGLILRAEVVWQKPNGLPESVTDRVRRSHETWFHLVQQPRYYSAVDELRQPHQASTMSRARHATDKAMSGRMHGSPGEKRDHANAWTPSPLGALPGSVWTVPTSPLDVPDHLGVDHYAAFPPEWPKRLITGWSPPGICVRCGAGRRPVAAVAVREPNDQPGRTILGYACDCPTPDAPTRPAVILDPFGGTGTTAMVASCLGRVGISVDLSHDYNRVARWRTGDPRQRARVLELPPPAEQADGQTSLFDTVEDL